MPLSIKIMSQQVKVEWLPNDDGTFDLKFVVKGASLKRSKDCKEWTVVDIIGRLPEYIECDGVQLPAKLVLKVYCRLKGEQYRDYCRRKEAEEVNRRSPLMRQYGRFGATQEGRLQPRQATE